MPLLLTADDRHQCWFDIGGSATARSHDGSRRSWGACRMIPAQAAVLARPLGMTAPWEYHSQMPPSRRWPVLAVLSLALAWTAWRFAPLPPSDATLAALSFWLPAVLALFGLIVTFYPPQPRRKGVWLGVFVLLLGVNWLTVKDQAGRNAAALTKANSETAAWQRKAATLQQQILDNQTGGESFAYVMPQVISGLETVPLRICSQGAALLSDVVVTLNRDSDYRDPKRKAALYTPLQSSAYSLSPGKCRSMKETIEPRVEPGSKVELWILTVAANNGSVDQTIRFRRGTLRPWEFQMDVRKRRLTRDGATQRLELHLVLHTDWSNAETEGAGRISLVE